MMVRLAIVVSHPTQFEAPLYAYLERSGRFDLKVFFWSTDQTTQLPDPELGHPSGWDFDLTQGYRYEVVPRTPIRRLQFVWAKLLASRYYDAIVVNGYAHPVAQLTLIGGLASGRPVVLRSDTTLLYAQRRLREALKALFFPALFRRIPAFMVMGSLSRQNLIARGARAASIFLFPYAVNNEYFERTSASYRKRRSHLRAEMGIAEEIAKPKAKALGYLYVFLMYNGYQIPILGLILVSIELLFKTNSRKKRKYLRLAFPLICLWGIIFLNFASHIVLQGDDFLLRFLSALLIWFFITVGFAIVFWLIKSIQHFSKKRITQNTVDKHET